MWLRVKLVCRLLDATKHTTPLTECSIISSIIATSQLHILTPPRQKYTNVSKKKKEKKREKKRANVWLDFGKYLEECTLSSGHFGSAWSNMSPGGGLQGRVRRRTLTNGQMHHWNVECSFFLKLTKVIYLKCKMFPLSCVRLHYIG